MDSPTPDTATHVAPIVFRGKKRKCYRQRGDTNNETSRPHSEEAQAQTPEDPKSPAPVPESASTSAPTITAAIEENEDEDGLSVAEVLRRRNARKSKLGGVTFGGNDANSRGDATNDDYDDELSRMIREEENRVLDISNVGVNKRFAPQTGLAVELVNKHMTEYIEAELAKRHSAESAARAALQAQSSSQSDSNATSSTGAAGMKLPDKNRALLGKLMEVDLGEESRSRNLARTDRAWRKLRGEAVEEEEEEDEAASSSKKARLGKDGKPLRSRNRRNSNDIRRDQLVEELLRENRLDVYDTPAPGPGGAAGPGGSAADEEAPADDRIAEQFRREFLDAMAQRHRRRHTTIVNKYKRPSTRKEEDILRGPKLGGSRNTRAAMRNILLQKEKEKKKK
ncbi:hypothetical protein F5X96DRAFT_645247 [Biscogniauxia mediterranea]|nr:hypothetical protein F5X96DRAFT_645247 [Biscogniauxia mediterranea]